MSGRSKERRAQKRAAENERFAKVRRRMLEGLDVDAHEEGVMRAEFRAANDILDEQGLTPVAVCSVGANCAGFTNQILAANYRKSSRVACAPGCTWCCALEISAWPVEVLQLAAWIESRETDEAVTAMVARLRETVANADAMHTAGQWPRTPCPLLTSERTCSVHDVRPSACATVYAADATACRAYAERPEDEEDDGTLIQVPVLSFSAEVASYVIMDRGGPDVARAGAKLDFHAGLADALDTGVATLAAAWLDGKDVLQGARERFSRRHARYSSAEFR